MTEKHPVNVPEIMKEWNLTALSWEKVKDVFKVATPEGMKNLKLSPPQLKRLSFVHQAIQHLSLNGFTRMSPLIPTNNGQTYICDDQYAYSLFDWIEGRQCDFRHRDELAEACRVFAEFHNKTAGFDPPLGSNMRKHLGKCLRNFEERYRHLLEFKAMAETAPQDPFARLYKRQVDFFLPMAAKAVVKMSQTSYAHLVTTAEERQVFCHGDPAARNFILTPERRVFMIDFDSCRLDLPVMDLIKFIRRVMKKYHWDFEVAAFIVQSYHQVNPLSWADLEVMRAAFYFPQKFWRMAVRHFHEHRRYTPERALHKFQKYISQRAHLSKFQTDFDLFAPELIRSDAS